MKEHWRYIPGYEPHYAVSTHGRVISLRKGKILSARLSTAHHPSGKYWRVELSVGGVRTQPDVHKLVLTAFRGPRPEGMQSRHLDGDRLNNHLTNLVWGTYEENRADKIRDGRAHKLTYDQIRYIRSSTRTLRALAAELGTCKSNVHLVRLGRTWADVV